MTNKTPVPTLKQVRAYHALTKVALEFWEDDVKKKAHFVDLNNWRVRPCLSIAELRDGSTACLGGILEMCFQPEQLHTTIHQLMGVCTGGVPWTGTHGELDLFSSRRRIDVTPYEEARQRLIDRIKQLQTMIKMMEMT